MAREVLRRLGVPPRRAVFVGDKLRTDVACARRAGLRSVWLRGRSGEPRTAADARPDWIVTDFREVPPLLAQLH